MCSNPQFNHDRVFSFLSFTVNSHAVSAFHCFSCPTYRIHNNEMPKQLWFTKRHFYQKHVMFKSSNVIFFPLNGLNLTIKNPECSAWHCQMSHFKYRGRGGQIMPNELLHTKITARTSNIHTKFRTLSYICLKLRHISHNRKHFPGVTTQNNRETVAIQQAA